MNNSITFLLVIAIALLASAQKIPASRYDSLDLDQILSNDRVLSNYIKCLLSKGPCTPEGRQLREDIPKALVDQCQQCTETQKKLVRKAAKFVQTNRPGDWALISKKFDPSGQYVESFTQFLNAAK